MTYIVSELRLITAGNRFDCGHNPISPRRIASTTAWARVIALSLTMASPMILLIARSLRPEITLISHEVLPGGNPLQHLPLPRAQSARLLTVALLPDQCICVACCK